MDFFVEKREIYYSGKISRLRLESARGAYMATAGGQWLDSGSHFVLESIFES